MASVLASITSEVEAFIRAQPVFFVATAPLSSAGHVNLSPKGLETFRILSPTRAGYLDLTGSGNETAAHVLENGRITFMFCAFAGPPKILRLYGRGSVITPAEARWQELAPAFQMRTGARQIIVADVHRVQTSCGFGVPAMILDSQRDALARWAAAKGESGLKTYRREKNARSIDGLPTPRLEPE